MSDTLVVFPFEGDERIREWLADLGVEAPSGRGATPERALVESIPRQADWPFRSRERDGLWSVDFEARDERRPPIGDLTLRSTHPCHLGFRLRPSAYGPYVVAREVARVCGWQIAVTGSMGLPCVVGPGSTYEEFHQALFECPPQADGKDRDWSEPPAEDWKHVNAAPEVWSSAPERVLDYALSGRRGYGAAAIAVGQALQAYRRRDQGGPSRATSWTSRGTPGLWPG